MNIAMFTNTYLPHVGGVANSVDSFSHDLCKLGHRVMIVCPEYGKTDEDKPESSTGPEIIRVKAIQNFNGSDFSMSFPSPVLIDNAAESFAPDIVHSHHPYLLGSSALRTARKREIPLIFTHHTMYEWYTHYVPMDSTAMARFAAAMAVEYSNLCDLVIAPSRSIQQILKERGVTTPMEEIPTGVDVSRFWAGDGESFRQKMGIPQNAFVAGHVGRLAPEKNLDYLAQAAASLIHQIPGSYFLCAGSGPSEESISKAFAQQKVEGGLKLCGSLTGKDLADCYAAMNVFLFASLTETQGMVLTEAMAAGLPVIALDAPGVREVVSDHENGRLLHDKTSPKDFAAAAKKVMDPDVRAPWQKNARKTCMAFSRERMAKKLVQVYENQAQESMHDSAAHPAEPSAWQQTINALGAEWELLSQKAAAAATLLTPEDE